MGVTRNRVIVFAVLLAGLSMPVLGLATLEFLRNRADQVEMPDPVHPAGVPAEAVFRGGPDGGYFIQLRRDDFRLADGRHLPAFHLTI